jgi:hypothetical protein
MAPMPQRAKIITEECRHTNRHIVRLSEINLNLMHQKKGDMKQFREWEL